MRPDLTGRRWARLTRFAATLVLAGSIGTTMANPAAFQIAQWLRPVPRQSVLAEAGYYVWGGSVVQEGGEYHMFYERWPTNTYAFGDGWLFGSEICHAVATNAGGPFTPTGVVLGRRTNDPALAFWDSQSQFNPHIGRFGGRFYLYYTGATDPGTNAWPGVDARNRIQRNQRIGVVAADSIQDLVAGNFVRPNAPIISPVYSTNAATDRISNPTDFAGNRIVNNQTVIQRADGKYQLIYKSNWPQSPGYGHGMALADDPAGPFTLIPGPLFSNQSREDENHWYDAARGKYYLVCKNFNAGGTEQLESSDSTNWVSTGMQFGRIIPWADGVTEPVEALERPQLLRDANGDPIMLYFAARRALAAGAKESFNVHIPLAPPGPGVSPLTNINDIKTNGLLIEAVNLGATNSVMINGVNFVPSSNNVAANVANYGFAQSGGAAGAALGCGLVETAYDGVAGFEDFLDTLVWQTGTAQAGAKLSFSLSGLTAGRLYRLQVCFGETRSGTASRHGPQTLTVGGETSAAFDYGPTSSLVATGATAIKFETTFPATGPVQPVTLTQMLGGTGGLQISAFAVHDVTPPVSASITMPPGGQPALAWLVVPGFTYTVLRSPDLAAWLPTAGIFRPAGNALLQLLYTDTAPPPDQAYYRLRQSD